ncbi:radical SAM protein [archaeon]|nr:MAG: radical SAM protein [archaeon]
MMPSYVTSLQDGSFESKRHALEHTLANCTLCPRECGVDRTAGERGYCNADVRMKIASWGAHHGEESPLVGTHGSGTIFLSHCPLRCIYCQNHDISIEGHGVHCSIDDAASMMLHLQGQGCHNINLVTPTHYTPQLVGAVGIAAHQGLRLPLVWNCGGYESFATIRNLDGIVDIYMPDVKYASTELATAYSDAPDYFERCIESLYEMHDQVGDLVVENGLATRGLLIRHLVLPGHVDDSKCVVDAVAELSDDSYLNIMEQYRPCHHASCYPGMDRHVMDKEVREVRAYARERGLRRTTT